MSRRRTLLAPLTLGLLLVAACGPRGALRSFSVGESLAEYTFTRSSEFEQGTYTGASLLVRDGVYRVDIREGDNELWWGQWGDSYDNVIIDVDVEQLSQRNENAYGIMCRVRGRVGQPVDASDLVMPTEEATPEIEATAEATLDADATAEATDSATPEAEVTVDVTEAAGDADEESEATEAAPEATGEATSEAGDSATGTTLEQNNGDGYLFLIQGGGSYGIFRARGRDLTPLVDWQTSEAIEVGPSRNHLRAVCMGDYLAFYVNDTLVADTTDSAYQQGQVGLAASAANRIGALIQFDNLTVAQANAG